MITDPSINPADSGDETEENDASYGQKVGARLRLIRRQKGLSLQEVEASSNQEFKASVLGAYERGERAISVPRLQRLARFYNVPVDQLLPNNDEGDDTPRLIDLTDRSRTGREGPMTLDLSKLERLSGPEAAMLARYVTTIQVQRQDFNGRVLTIRREDLWAIAAVLGTTLEDIDQRLDDLGLRYVTA